MRENLQVVVITVAIFAAGLLLGLWIHGSQSIPPPPIVPMGEFMAPSAGVPFPPPPLWLAPPPASIDPAEMQRAVGLLRPQIHDFQEKVTNIENTFRKKFEAILSPDQQSAFQSLPTRLPERMPVPLPGCSGEIGFPLVPIIIYRPMYDYLSDKLHLSDAQRKQFQQLLVERRNQMIQLFDQTPPPSLSLGKILEGRAAVGAVSNDPP